jgi:hypothetical protein
MIPNHPAQSIGVRDFPVQALPGLQSYPPRGVD